MAVTRMDSCKAIFGTFFFLGSKYLILVDIGLQGFLGYYEFRSKTHQDKCCPEGLCKATMFALFVKEELEVWPEQKFRNRKWLSVTEAFGSCRHPWMRDVLDCFCKWCECKLASASEDLCEGGFA